MISNITPHNATHTSLSLLLFLVLLVSQSLVKASSPNDGPPTTTVIDILSENAEFSTFLLTLQRSGLIESVNDLANFTLLAPINSAYSLDSVALAPKLSLHDLNRYIISEPLVSSDIAGVKISADMNQSPILLDYTTDIMMIDQATVVEADLEARSQDAVVQGIDILLQERPNLCTVLRTLFDGEETKSFSKILGSDCLTLENVTGLIPLDSVSLFDEHEISYLLTHEGKEDRELFLKSHFLKGYIGGVLEGDESTYQDLLNQTVQIRSHQGGQLIQFENFTTDLTNYPSYNTLLHFFNESILPDLVHITPRKYLLGLNQSDFVQELDFRDLSYLIDDSSINQTIFVYPSSEDSVRDIGTMGVHKNSLMYQFVGEKVDIHTDRLVDSKFCGGKLGKNCQRIKISSFGDDGSFLNNHVYVHHEKYEADNTVIYLIDDNLTLPPRLEVSVSPFLGCSKALRYLKDFSLLSLPDNKQGYTVFLPCYDSWKDLGLTLKYLQSNSTAMKMAMQSLVLNGLVYSDFDGTSNLTSIGGSKTQVKSSIKDECMQINNVNVQVEHNSDVLFAQGVAHAINKFVFPDDLEITLKNLVDSTDSELFSKVMELTNLTYIFDSGQDYSLLLPTSRSLKIDNITTTRDIDYLEKLVKLHILPGDAAEKLRNCESKIPTLLNGTHLSCRELSTGNYMLQIVEGLDHEVRVLQHGFTTSPNRTGMFLIDRPISPRWLENPDGDGKLRIHLPGFAIAIGVIIGMITLLLLILCCLVLSAGKNKSFDDDDGERDPLVSGASTIPGSPRTPRPYAQHRHGQGNRQYGAATTIQEEIAENTAFNETGYSGNASTKPIEVSREG